MEHRTTYPRSMRLERSKNLPLVFEGWRVAHAMTENYTYAPAAWSSLALYETLAGTWVLQFTHCSREGHCEYVTTIHASRDDAIHVMGVSSNLAQRIRRDLGYATVEALA